MAEHTTEAQNHNGFSGAEELQQLSRPETSTDQPETISSPLVTSLNAVADRYHGTMEVDLGGTEGGRARFALPSTLDKFNIARRKEFIADAQTAINQSSNYKATDNPGDVTWEEIKDPSGKFLHHEAIVPFGAPEATKPSEQGPVQPDDADAEPGNN